MNRESAPPKYEIIPIKTAPADTVMTINCMRSVTARPHIPAKAVYKIIASPEIAMVNHIGRSETKYRTSPTANKRAQQYSIEAMGTTLESTPEVLL